MCVAPFFMDLRARDQAHTDTIIVRGLPVYSEKYHLYGICDVVEFHKNDHGSWIPFLECRCDVVPIEYKHGRIRRTYGRLDKHVLIMFL